MTFGRIGLGALGVLGVVAALFACAASDESAGPATDDAGTPEAAAPADADAGTDASDAATDDEFVVPDGAVACATTPCAVSISATGGTFCALLQDGTVACWGSNDQGQLGYDAGTDFPPASPTARLVDGLTGVTSVSVGDGNTCARVTDGGVYCWGAPELVNAGLDPDAGAPFDDLVVAPARESAVPPASSVAVGSRVACVMATSGALSCWGQNGNFELGRGRTDDPDGPPGNVDLGGAAAALVHPGFSRTFVITNAGSLVSWGASTQYGGSGFLLGRDTSEDPDPAPAVVPNLSRVRAIATGAYHSCAIAGRYVDCWGSDDSGELGRGSFGPLVFLPGPSNLAYVVDAEDLDAGTPNSGDVPLQVSVGDGFSCAVMGSGRVYCWGDNGFGQLGERVTSQNDGHPQRIVGLSGPAVGLASGGVAVCALLRTGAVECWGANDVGELTTSPYDNFAHPQPVAVTFPH